MRPTPTLLGLPRELRDEIIYHTIAADDLRESAEKFTKDYNDADDKHGWKWLALRSDLLQHATQSNNQPEHTYNFVLAMTLVNRQIRDETKDLLAKVNPRLFFLDVLWHQNESLYSTWLHVPPRGAGDIPLVNVRVCFYKKSPEKGGDWVPDAHFWTTMVRNDSGGFPLPSWESWADRLALFMYPPRNDRSRKSDNKVLERFRRLPDPGTMVLMPTFLCNHSAPATYEVEYLLTNG